MLCRYSQAGTFTFFCGRSSLWTWIVTVAVGVHRMHMAFGRWPSAESDAPQLPELLMCHAAARGAEDGQ